MFLWRIGNQEQARTVADHFAFSVDSSCIIISGKKDNLERLTEILKRISEYVLFHSTLKFLTYKHLPWNYIGRSSRINCYQSGKCREPK